MKKYSFRLQTLLSVRELFEEEAERHFGMAMRDLTLAVEELEGLRNELARAVSELGSQPQEEYSINVRMLYDNYFKGMRGRIDKQIGIVRAAEAVVEERRAELLERMKDRKTIEKLRVRDYDQFLLELRRHEQSIIDDLATLRSGLRNLTAVKGTAL